MIDQPVHRTHVGSDFRPACKPHDDAEHEARQKQTYPVNRMAEAVDKMTHTMSDEIQRLRAADRQEGVEAERARIVAWLRGEWPDRFWAAGYTTIFNHDQLNLIAEGIERGDHAK